MPEKRGFARRHRSSFFPFFKLLPKPRIARYLPCISYSCTRALADISRGDTTRAHTRTYMHARIHPSLILLEATDAPISARVSFVIRENVNQSPGPRRLLFLRASSLLYILSLSRECMPTNVYVCECIGSMCVCVCMSLVSRTRR